MSTRENGDLEQGRSYGDPQETEQKLSPWMAYPRMWRRIFLASCVIGVAIDPLFLFIPVINEEKKCLTMDGNMKKVALVLRTATDLIYFLHLIVRYVSASTTANKFSLSMRTGFPWLNLLINILAIIPLPQVIVLKYFSKIAGSRSLTTRKVLNLLLMLQYVPRILRVYLSAKDLERAFDNITGRVWVKGFFNFFLYIMTGYIFGAFWYFYAIYRETACWHHACTSYPGCVPSPFDCDGIIPMTNLTFINDFCPINPPNAEVFDFGIYAEAIGSRVLVSTNFLNKFSRSLWWGLRNLSSFGSNLQTSSNTEENLFAVLISILGLLLFLYLIGNLQTYMQVATKNSEKLRVKSSEKRQEIKLYLSHNDHELPNSQEKLLLSYLRRRIKQGKDVDVDHLFPLIEDNKENSQRPPHDQNKEFVKFVTTMLQGKTEKQAESWIKYHKIPNEMSLRIMHYVRLKMREGEDVDVRNLLCILPPMLRTLVKKHLCFPIVKKVPVLENLDEVVYNTICSYLKPVVYQENSYIIREGEPLNFMLFITQGVAWRFRSSSSPMERLQRGDYYGIGLLKRRLRETLRSNFPAATFNVKSQTKVEAFTLSSIDLEDVLFLCSSKIPFETDDAKKATMAATIFLRKTRHEP